jgi:Protein of unknown function (DUF2934)
MPRKRKTSDNEVASPDGAHTGNGSTTAPVSKKKAAPRRKSGPKKIAAEGAADSPQITDEAIRVRAYLIAEERARRGLPGDENSDWLEARRQLIDEIG